MRTPSCCLLVALVLTSAAVSAEVPWTERYQIPDVSINGVPTSAERLAEAEVLFLSRWVLDECFPPEPGCPAHGYLLAVDRWHTNTGTTGCTQNACPKELCPATTPFYGQATPRHHCSGILVGKDLVLTAGHCMDGLNCAHQRFVFDFAVKFAGDPIGNPIPQQGGQVFLPFEDVYACDSIKGIETPFPPGTDPDDAFAFENPGGDWALIQLTEEVTDRLPVPTERFAESLVGDTALILGHPARIPLKAEIQQISTYTASGLSAPFAALQGNSGSGIINLNTGKVAGIAVTGPMAVEDSTHPSCQLGDLHDLCFTCANSIGAQGTLPLAAVIPKIGLQVTPVPTAHHYGPPTSPTAFPGVELRLSAPAGELPITWSVVQEGPVQILEVWEGDTAGTLDPGESAAVRIGPVDWITETQGLTEVSMPFLDHTYGTKTRLMHTLHVGLDGFAVLPADTFDGADDLGVHHDDGRTYGATNRWIVDQDVTVTATVDPEDPNAPWPDWLLLEGGTTAVSLTLPCKGCGPAPTVDLAIDGTNLDPGTYSGTVVLTSEDSGTPPFEILRPVYFDHCREVFADLTVPEVFVLPPQGGIRTQPLIVSPTGGTEIADVDVIADLAITGAEPGTHVRRYKVSLRSPDPGTELILKNFDDPPQAIYDEDTRRFADQSLDNFNDFLSAGPWLLILQNDPESSDSLELTLNRFHVRLHHQDAPPCVTDPDP